MEQKITLAFLDRDTLGPQLNLDKFHHLGQVKFYEQTPLERRAAHLSGVTVAVANKVLFDAPLMDACPQLKLVVLTATGTNNVDLAAARERGIGVCNVPHYSTPSVAQHTFALVLYLMEHLGYYQEYTSSGTWSRSQSFTHLDRTFHEIAGKTWGIIGLGDIGRQVAKIAEAFGAKVQYTSTSGVDRQEPWPRVDKDTLFYTSDIISIHAPISDRTRNFITRPDFEKMKQEVILVNVGRGGIIHEGDLARALDLGIIAGAGLDVLETEPMRPDSPLLKLRHPERLFVTPHIAWASVESRNRCLEVCRQNILDWMAGGRLNRVEGIAP